MASSKVLFSILPPAGYGLRALLEQFGFLFLLFFIFYFSGWIIPVVSFLFRAITGGIGP